METNKLNLISGKKADVAITLLVFMVLLLVAATLFIFVSDSAKKDNDLTKIGLLGEVYAREEQINYYLQDITDKAGSESQTKEEFIKNFKSEFEKYKNPDGSYIMEEFNFIEFQIKDENFNFDDKTKTFSAKFDISIKGTIGDAGNSFFVNYDYRKESTTKIKPFESSFEILTPSATLSVRG